MTLRASDYAPLAQRVQAIQGVQAVQGTAPLAPSRSFARALLGRCRAGHRRADQALQRQGRGRRRRRPVGPRGALPGPAGGDAGAADRHPRSQRRADRHAAAPPPPARGSTAHDARPRRPAGGRGGARRQQGEVRAGRRAALDRRHPRGRQPPDRRHLRPRARRPLPARLDVQGRHHRGAAARGAEDERHGRLPADDHRRRQAVQELRGRGGGRRALRHATSRSRATRRSSRSRRGWPPTPCRARRATSASGAPAPARSRPAATPWRARRR